jgi:hypothetical protein
MSKARRSLGPILGIKLEQYVFDVALHRRQ